MKYLLKVYPEPQKFIEAITEENPKDGASEKKTSFSSLIKKENLRMFLLEEQHYLCLYCQSTIDLKTSQAEHYLSQKNNPSLSLDYSNLYASCECNELKRTKASAETSEMRNDFCGNRKGHTELVWSPVKDSTAIATQNHPNPFFEVNTETGEIIGFGENEMLVNEFIRICNLNHKILKRARSEAYKAVTDSGLPLKEMVIRVASHPELAYNQFILNGLLV